MNQIWIETTAGGHWQASDAPVANLDDRGLAYGDGLFETVRVQQGVPLFLSRHLRRMQAGLERLSFPAWPVEDESLLQRCREAIRRNAVDVGVLKIVVTRGRGPRGFEPPAQSQPMLMLQATHLPPRPATLTGLQALIASWKVDPASPLCYVKHLSALDKVLARQAAQAGGADEALFLNMHDFFTEGATSNLFLVVQETILTPAERQGVLPGIVRGLLLEAGGALPLPVLEADIPLGRLAQASEAFLTNSIMGVRPLVAIAGQPIGAGKPGPITKFVAEYYRRLEEQDILDAKEIRETK